MTRTSQRPTPDGRKVPTRTTTPPPRATPETTTNGPTRVRVVGRGQSAVPLAVGGDHAPAHVMSHDHVSVRPLGAPVSAGRNVWRPGYVRPDPFAGCGASAARAALLRRAAVERAAREDAARPVVRVPVDVSRVPFRGVRMSERPGYVAPRDARPESWCDPVDVEPAPVPWRVVGVRFAAPRVVVPGAGAVRAVRLGCVEPVAGVVRDAPADAGVLARAADAGVRALARRAGRASAPVRGAAPVAPVVTDDAVVPVSRAARRRDRRARVRVVRAA